MGLRDLLYWWISSGRSLKGDIGSERKGISPEWCCFASQMKRMERGGN